VKIITAERDWLVTKDAGHHLSATGDLSHWETAVTKLATFHRHADPSAFETLGCPFYPFETLANRGEAFLRDISLLQNWGMTHGQIAELQQVLPHLLETCSKVKQFGLRECVLHGDAQPMNALVNDANVIWFDWSEGSVAHPFVEVGWFLAWTFLPKRELSFRTTPELAWQFWQTCVRARGIDDANLTPLDVMRLALIHRALVYHQKFYTWPGASQPTRPQYVPYFLRLLLKTNCSVELIP
jgi:hypothetical protein